VQAALAIALLGLPGVAPAQADIPREALLWAAWFSTVELSPRWSVGGEFHERRFVEAWRPHQRVWRTHVMRRLSPSTQVGVGYTYFLQGEITTTTPVRAFMPEHRPHVQLDITQRANPRVTFAHRARLEYRGWVASADGSRAPEVEAAGRLRYRLQGEWSLRKHGASVRLSDEFHVMFGDRPVDQLFDQNRVQVGVRWPVSRSLATEVAYLWWYQRRRAGGVLERDHVRLTVEHRYRLGSR
jgi:hypothetical protein